MERIYSSQTFTTAVAFSIVLLGLSYMTSAQQPPPQPQPQPPTGGEGGGLPPQNSQNNLCGSRFEAALGPQCFDTNNVNFTGVIYILSGNRTGAIPQGYTYTSFLDFLCGAQMQDKLIPCVLKQMQRYNSTQCTEEDRMGVLGRGGQLLAFMDAVCGEPCEQEATQSLIQCYAAINVNPEPILNPNASIAEDKFSIVGTNQTEFDNFCNNRQKLFSCLSPLTSTCPGLLERLYTIGIDLEAMEGATELICKEKQNYFKSLECFNKPSQSITQCRQQTESNMRQVLVGRYQSGDVLPSAYMNKLCEAKLTQVDCELSAYAQTCDSKISDLRNAVECSMLPDPCKTNEQFKPVYSKICQTVTTPAPSNPRPTKPAGGPGEVPGTNMNAGRSDNSRVDDGDDDDGDDNGAPLSTTSSTLTVLCVGLLTFILMH